MTHEAVELDERARVAEPLGPLAREQLPGLALPRDRLLRARVQRLARAAPPATGASRRVVWALLRPSPRGSLPCIRVGGHDAGRPLDDLAVRRARRAGRVLLPALRPPGRRRRRARLGELEGGDALLFASGTARRSRRALALAPAGHDDRARRGRVLRHGHAARARALGARVRRVRPDRTPRPQADLVWVEAPANPLLTQPDWEAVRAHAGLVVCDATVSTPVYLRALDEGADVVVHSATKYLTRPPQRAARRDGHARPRAHGRLLRPADPRRDHGVARRRGGAPRGLETLETRMRRQTETATELARRLDGASRRSSASATPASAG